MRSRSGIRPSSRATRVRVSGFASCVAVCAAVDASRSGFAIALLLKSFMHTRSAAAARSLGRRLLSSPFGLDSALLVEGLEITDDLRDRRSQLPHYLTDVLRSQPLLSPPTLTSAKCRLTRRHPHLPQALLAPAELAIPFQLQLLTP